MRKRILPLLLILSCIFHFSGKSSFNFNVTEDEGKNRYGGIFRMNLEETFVSLFPLSVVDNSSRHVAGQVYEGLARFDPKTLAVQPGLAKQWEVSADHLVYMFHLRTNVSFHDDSCFAGNRGRRMVAGDVKYCLDKVCESSSQNIFGFLFRNVVEGAAAFYDSNQKVKYGNPGVNGIRVINDSVLEVRLEKPLAVFPQLLCLPGCWIYPREAWEKYGEDMRVKCVGTGPFRLSRVHEDSLVLLERNPNYWNSDRDGNRLPYLDSIRITFHPGSQLQAFREEELDMLILSTPEDIRSFPAMVNDFASTPPKFILSHTPSMAITYFGFQAQAPPFDDVRVRKAFCMAINRDVIVDSTMNGLGFAAHSGLFPPVMQTYPSATSLEYDPVMARKLLAKAGYRRGKRFPKISIDVNPGQMNRAVAETIQKMLRENLNIEVSISVKPFANHLSDMTRGKSLFWRSAWVPDYPDPQAILSILYGKNVPGSQEMASFPNAMRYKSSAFDQRYEAALAEHNNETRMALLQNAEQIALNDAAICPLYFYEPYLLLHMKVRGYHMNALDLRSFTEVWLEKKN